MPHDVVGVRRQPLHGRVVEAGRLLGVDQRLLHVGRVVGHWKSQGIVAGGGAGLGGLAQSGTAVGKPDLK